MYLHTKEKPSAQHSDFRLSVEYLILAVTRTTTRFLCNAAACVPGSRVACLMSTKMPSLSVLPPTTANCARSSAYIGLTLVVASVLLSMVGIEKTPLHIVWEANQIHNVKVLASAALPQPSIQPSLQRGQHTQEAISRSIGSSIRQVGFRPAASAPLILIKPTKSSVPMTQNNIPTETRATTAEENSNRCVFVF